VSLLKSLRSVTAPIFLYLLPFNLLKLTLFPRRQEAGRVGLLWRERRHGGVRKASHLSSKNAVLGCFSPSVLMVTEIISRSRTALF
jgi:hypothetical protein